METKELAMALLGAASNLTSQLDSGLSRIKGISFGEYQLLAALRDHPASAASRVDLAASVHLSPSGVTRALRPLEAIGLVEATRDLRDARKSLARLTDAGSALLEDADAVVDDVIAGVSALNELTGAGRPDLVNLLRQIERV